MDAVVFQVHQSKERLADFDAIQVEALYVNCMDCNLPLQYQALRETGHCGCIDREVEAAFYELSKVS